MSLTMANLDSGEPIVITEDGVPRSTRVPTSDATPIEEVREVVFARARKAVREIRARAAKTGAADLTNADIEREIKAVRRTRASLD